jgi:acyl-CoA thioesterase-1
MKTGSLEPSRRKLSMKSSPFRSALLAVPLLAFSAAAHAQPRMPTHVACIGDSITEGVSNSAGKNWPSDLQGLFGAGVVVKGFGKSGTTMLTAGNSPYVNTTQFTAAQQFVKDAGPGAVVNVIILLGTNDSKPVNWTPNGKPKQDQQFLQDTSAMVDTFMNLATKPVVYLALPPTAYANGFGIDGAVIKGEQIPLLQQVAKAKGLPLVDVNTPTFVPMPTSLFTDGVHPNDAGALLIAQVMHEGLLRVPSVSVTAPVEGASVAGPISLTADASGGTVAITQVEFFDGTSSLGVAKQSPFSIVLENPTIGDHSVTARATDATSAAATSSAVAFHVDALGTTGAGGAATSTGTSAGTGAGGTTSGGEGGSGITPGTDTVSACSTSNAAAPGSLGGLGLVGIAALLARLRRRHRRSTAAVE